MTSKPDNVQGYDKFAWAVSLGWPLLFLLVGFCLVPLAATCQLQCVPGDLGDARFNNVVLEHLHRWLGGYEASLLSPPYFYPMPGALTFSDNHLGTAWIYTLFRSLGWDRYLAYDLWFLCGSLLNFTISHWVFRRLSFSPLASALAAFAFTFAMPVTARFGHSQLGYRFLIPVGLLLWQSFRKSRRWRWLAGLALAVAGQFYISIYLGYFMLLLLAAWALAQWSVEGWGPRHWFAQWCVGPGGRREPIIALLTMLAAAALIALLIYPYLHYSKLYGFQRAAAEIASLLPRPQSYLLADSSALWGSISQTLGRSVPMRHEQQIFFGLGIFCLAAAGLLLSKSGLRWIALGAIGLLVLLTVSVGGVSLYLLLVKLPGVGSVRAMARIGLVLALPLALLVAIGVDALRARGLAGMLVLAVLSLLMVAEAGSVRTANFPIDKARQHDAGLRLLVPTTLPADALLFNPLQSEVPFYESELDGVILAQSLGRPTLNGYSGNLPRGYDPRVTSTPCEQAYARLDAAMRSELIDGLVATSLSAKELVIPGIPVCPDRNAISFPLVDASRLSLQILSVDDFGPQRLVHVRLTNHSGSALNLAAEAPEPLRLSWQAVDKGRVPDPLEWKPRISFEGPGVLPPGGSRDAAIALPDAGNDGQLIFISAVLEGKAWLHEHGFKLVLVDSVTTSQPNR